MQKRKRNSPGWKPSPKVARAVIKMQLARALLTGKPTVSRTFKLLEEPPKQAFERQDYMTEMRAEKFYRENGVFCGWCEEPRSLYSAEVCGVVIDLCVECLDRFDAKLKGRKKNRAEEEDTA